MENLLERSSRYLMSDRSEAVNYKVELEKRYSVSTSNHVLLCLLYKQTDNDVFFRQGGKKSWSSAFNLTLIMVSRNESIFILNTSLRQLVQYGEIFCDRKKKHKLNHCRQSM